MLLKDSTKLDERIVRQLAAIPGSTGEELQESLSRQRPSVTLRGVFKSLRKLQDLKVVIKVRNTYSLRLSWVVELKNFTDDIFKNYRKRSLFYLLLPDDGRSVVWNFPDPALADDFWRQVALSLFEKSEKRNMFYWIRHAWFQFPSIDEEKRFQEVLRSRGYKIHIIVEGNTYLDREECKGWPSDPYFISFAPSPFRTATYGSLSVIGDYVVTLTIDRHMRERINEIFGRVRSAKDLQLGEIRSLFHMKGKCSLKVEHDAAKAQRLKRQFARYFGVSAEMV